MNNFNFFSPYIDTKQLLRKKYKYFLILFIVVFVGTAISSYIYQIKVRQLEKEISKMKIFLQSSKINKKIIKAQEKEDKVKIIKQYYNTLKSLDAKIDALDIINKNLLIEISTTLPTEITFDALSITSDEIQIKGKSENNAAIAELEYNLRQLNLFDNIHVFSINYSVEESQYAFSITCKLKEVSL